MPKAGRIKPMIIGEVKNPVADKTKPRKPVIHSVCTRAMRLKSVPSGTKITARKTMEISPKTIARMPEIGTPL